MTYLDGVHGIIIGGIQNFTADEVVYDRYNNLVHTTELQKDRESKSGIARSHGPHKIASFLREYGADIEVLDFAFSWTFEELKDIWKSRYYSKTLFFCVSTVFKCSGAPIWMFVEWLRENYPHIYILGGTQSLDKILPYKLDWYVFGYGEYAMLELVKALKDNTISKIKYIPVGEKKVINAQKDYPAFPKKNLSMSYEDRDFIKSWELLPLELSRGCIFQCAFCSYPILGIRDDHSRDENNLYDELLENYERWGTKHYLLSDETVNDYHEKLERYAKVIKKLPFKPRLSGYARADILVARKKSWETYVEMGFMNHFYGVESLHHPSAKSIGKGMDSGRLKEGLLEWKQYAYKNNDFYAGYISLIAGLPYETLDTLNDGVTWLKKHWRDNFAAMGYLTINLPDYGNQYDELVKSVNDMSLIEKDPEKYGYTINKDVMKSQQSSLKTGVGLNGQYDKQELIKRFDVDWTNNTGLTKNKVIEWFKDNNTAVICKGSIPPWQMAEFLVDTEKFNYMDMSLKTDKKYDLELLGHYNISEFDFTAKDSEYAKGMSTDAIGEYVQRYIEKLPKDDGTKNPEVDGITFTSPGRYMTRKTNTAKIDFIKQYKMNKLNA